MTYKPHNKPYVGVDWCVFCPAGLRDKTSSFRSMGSLLRSFHAAGRETLSGFGLGASGLVPPGSALIPDSQVNGSLSQQNPKKCFYLQELCLWTLWDHPGHNLTWGKHFWWPISKMKTIDPGCLICCLIWDTGQWATSAFESLRQLTIQQSFIYAVDGDRYQVFSDLFHAIRLMHQISTIKSLANQSHWESQTFRKSKLWRFRNQFSNV